MDKYPKSRIRLSRQGVICCGDETDVPVIPDMTRVQRYCLVVGMSCAETSLVRKLLPRGKLIINSKPRPSAPPSKSLPAQIIVEYIGIRLICVTPMYVAVKYIGRGILKLNPDVSRKHIHRNSRERWHPDVSSTNKNMIVLCIYKNFEIEDRKT